VTTPDGSVVTSVVTGDPRWGLNVPMTKALAMQLPSGLTPTVSAARALELSTPGDPSSLLWQEE